MPFEHLPGVSAVSFIDDIWYSGSVGHNRVVFLMTHWPVKREFFFFYYRVLWLSLHEIRRIAFKRTGSTYERVNLLLIKPTLSHNLCSTLKINIFLFRFNGKLMSLCAFFYYYYNAEYTQQYSINYHEMTHFQKGKPHNLYSETTGK